MYTILFENRFGKKMQQEEWQYNPSDLEESCAIKLRKQAGSLVRKEFGFIPNGNEKWEVMGKFFEFYREE